MPTASWYIPFLPREEVPVTVDEELTLLDESIRRLKVEYDVYFGGGSKRPPDDTEWRVKSLIKKYSDSGKLSFAQRFRYNTIAQRYAIFSDLWRQKLKIKEEGYRRPQDALLAITGMRKEEEHAATEALSGKPKAEQAEFKIRCSEVEREQQQVASLFNAMREARRRAGLPEGGGDLQAFSFFLKLKTEQIRRDFGCHAVEFAVEVSQGQVKLKARAQV
jgi:hypothetical protein